MRLANRYHIKFIFSLLLALPLCGQYWQQHVEYDMDVRLDTETNSLIATSKFLYVNNSPDSLDQILMQLYHNAYNEGTIAEEVWLWYDDSFDTSKGVTGITVIGVGTDSTDYEFEIRDDTILDIELPANLASGDSLRFSMEWVSKLHPYIDRSGYKGDQYDLAQWYPKFIVYDENGWHDDPFGDWGEFYGEFGTFKVTLDLPLSHIVCATGTVIEGDPGWSEVSVDTSVAWDEWFSDFHEKRQEYRKTLTDSLRRTVTFFAQNVHDFAWVSSPDFVYEHNQWQDIDIHALFVPHVGEDWTKDVARHGAQAVQWLSERFGHYPWPQMTIVKALISGGMEYPMLVMNGSESEGLIVHEIGHNWFFGLFGNDELDDAWMDEGFTTFQTRWYQQHYYPENDYTLSREYVTRFEYENLPLEMYSEAEYKPIVRYMLSPEHEALATRSFDFHSYASYRENVYTKGSYLMEMLKNHLGETRFLAGMQLYYERWALKHVNEARFIKAMEDASGEELDWFFDQWLHTTKYVDYTLDQVETVPTSAGLYRTTIDLTNQGGFFVPIPIALYSHTGDTLNTSLKEFKHRTHPYIEVETSFKPNRVYLDPDNLYFDVDRRDNDTQRKRAWRYNYKGWDAYPNDRNLYLWNPQFGFNDTDGLGLGLRLDRVYRNTGSYSRLELDYNVGSGVPDIKASFRHIQTGLPVEAVWYGSAMNWREMLYADLAYEISWAKVFRSNPIHFLTLKLDLSERSADGSGIDLEKSYTRLGFKYELQNDRLGGLHGFSFQSMHAPDNLSHLGKSFSQTSVMNSWIRAFSRFTVNNRTNLLINSEDTPILLMSRLASQDHRSIYLDRVASSVNHLGDDSDLSAPYYLAGGGRLRGYAGDQNIAANYIWSNNLELKLPDRVLGEHRLGIHGFFDVGQYSMDAEDWEWVSDFGFGIEFKPYWERNGWISTYFRPVKIKIEVPLARYQNETYSGSEVSNQWLFSISN